METQLLNNETKQYELSIESDKFILTDKRLIYSNAIDNSNVFIRINELRGAEVKSEDVSYDKFQLGDKLVNFLSLVLVIMFGIYMVFTTHAWGESGVITMMILSAFIGIGAAYLVASTIVFLLRLYIKATRRVVNQAALRITKQNNNLFFGRHYDNKHINDLRQFERELNSVIFQ